MPNPKAKGHPMEYFMKGATKRKATKKAKKKHNPGKHNPGY